MHIDGLSGARSVVVLGLSLLTMLLGGVLALDRGDLWYRHIVRRQLKRSQLARRDTDVPGFVFLEIDGLAHDVLRRALRDGNAPFLARWIHDDGYQLHGWETHWSSQTGACQAGLLHGNDHDMPAFRWWEKDLGRAIVTNHPKDAAEIERRHSDGRGLLHDDGASRANILSGDAAHSMLTMSTVLDRDRPGRLGQDYFAYFASPVRRRAHGAADDRRDRGRALVGDPAGAPRRAPARAPRLELRRRARVRDRDPARPAGRGGDGRHPRRAARRSTRRSWPTTRSRTTPGWSGPDTLAVLRRVDRAIANIAAAVPHAPRPYRLVVLSDHGQSQGATFLQRYGEGSRTSSRRHGGARCAPRTRTPTRAARRSTRA